MTEGYGATNSCIEERDRARRQLEVALEDNRILRKLLNQVRPVLITRKHKQLIDKALRTRPPS